MASTLRTLHPRGEPWVTAAHGAAALTARRNVFLSPGEPDPASTAGRRVLAHELTRVLQQRDSRERVQQFRAAERPQIARDLAAMMAVVQSLVTASSNSSGAVDMDKLVTHAAGGRLVRRCQHRFGPAVQAGPACSPCAICSPAVAG